MVLKNTFFLLCIKIYCLFLMFIKNYYYYYQKIIIIIIKTVLIFNCIV